MSQLSMFDTLFGATRKKVNHAGIIWESNADGIWRQTGGRIRAGDFAKPAPRELVPLLDALATASAAKSGARAFF